MGYYTGIDLHANNNYLGIINEKEEKEIRGNRGSD